MSHCVVPEAEKILDKEFPVLDKGFVRLVDYLGGDQRIVQSARVSYGAGTKTVSEDSALIDYLLRHQHTSPFEQVVLTFHVKMPIFVARQWVRHRTGRMNEISGRYSIMEEEFYVPSLENIAPQSPDNKQGRSKEAFPAEEAQKIQNKFIEGQKRAYEEYESLIDGGLAREIARINLPLSLYTEFYWEMDLHNLFHFLKLRLETHAQYEIREYAKVLLELTRKVAPLAVKSFENHMERGVRFSGEEMKALQEILEGRPNPLEGKKLSRFLEKIKTGVQL
ncbi:FAD-dependent thymidylate synthase [Treponema parvum]|uniref:Flavin-dependent thymidylate synthase n=1 Tax=Treponema parvum TaxID=138851 RepID=A0A975F2C5_9SPIR|nr:FAD-dependent thymidylate synthase [Treponema parvum]QTQ13117.1 FAD-dependent thymidylate synthase [Treponema parvum]